MTPEKEHFQENLGLNNYTPEQLEKVKTELKDKIDTLKKDGSFSGEDLKELVDLLDDKAILSPTEAELKFHLETLNDLNNQIDFLMALINIGEKNDEKSFETNKENDNQNIGESIKNIDKLKSKFNNDSESLSNLEEISNMIKILKNQIDSDGVDMIDGIQINDTSLQNKLINEKIEKLLNNDEITSFHKNEIKILCENAFTMLDHNPKDWGENIFSKDINEINDIGELLAIIEYTNKNFIIISQGEKNIFEYENSLRSAFGKENVLKFQNKIFDRLIDLIEEINKKESIKNSGIVYEIFENNYDEFKGLSCTVIKTENGKETNLSNTIIDDKNNDNQKRINFINDLNIKNINGKLENFNQKMNEKIEKFFNENIYNLSYEEISLVLKNIDNISQDKIDELANLYENSGIDLSILNTKIINKIVKNVNIDGFSFKNLNINKNFLEDVDLKLIFDKENEKNDSWSKVIFLEKISTYIGSGNDEILKEKLSFLKGNDILNIPSLLNLKILLLGEGNLNDLNKNFKEIVSNNLNIIENPEHKELTINFILNNINSRNSNDKELAFNILDNIINNIGLENLNQSQREKLLYLPKNLEIVKLFIKSKNNIEKDGKSSLGTIINYIPNDIKNNSEYIDLVIEKIDFNISDSEDYITKYFDLNKDLVNTYKILKKIKDKYGKKFGKIFKENEEKEIGIFSITNSGDYDKLSNEEKIIFSNINDSLERYINLAGKTLDNYRNNDFFENNQNLENIKNKLDSIIKDEECKEKILKLILDKNISSENVGKKIISILNKYGIIEEKSNKEEVRKKLKEIYKIVFDSIKETSTENIDNINSNQKDIKNFLIKNYNIDTDEFIKFVEENNDEKKSKKELIDIFLKEKNIPENNRNNIKKELLKYFNNEEDIITETKRIKDAKLINNNSDAFIDYAISGYKGSFKDFANENKIALKDENGEIINKKEIGLEKNDGFYIKDGIIYSGKYEINIEKGELSSKDGEKVELSNSEKQMIKTNPEIAKNIINLFSSLQKIGLDKIWKFRENIFKAIENISGGQFERDDGNYFDEREVKILLNSILVSIGEKPLKTSLNTETFLAEIENKNGRQITGGERQVNFYGESYLEEKFIEKFVGRGDIIGFKQGAFEKSLK